MFSTIASPERLNSKLGNSIVAENVFSENVSNHSVKFKHFLKLLEGDSIQNSIAKNL